MSIRLPQKHATGCTSARLRSEIDKVELAYAKCWNTLAVWKEGGSGLTTEQMVTFQPVLCGALLSLATILESLSTTRKGLIARKKEFHSEWFRKRMKALSTYEDVAHRAVAVGKSIGDAFAWWFLRLDQEFVEQHAKYPEAHIQPVGIGGIGELEFIRRTPLFQDYVVIYHGITTFLRIGDVTLFDLQTSRIVGIGELKTRAADSNRLEVSLVIKAFKNVNFRLAGTLPDSKRVAMPASLKERLARQLKSMDNAIAKAKAAAAPERVYELSVEPNVKALVECVRHAKIEHFNYVQATKGLLLAAFRRKRSSLWYRLMHEIPDLNKKLRGVEQHILKILLPELRLNQLLLEHLHYVRGRRTRMMLGVPPLFWRVPNTEVARLIVFRQVEVTCIHNPGPLAQILEQHGYDVTIDPPRKAYRLNQSWSDGRSVQVERLEYFLQLIQECFIPEEQVAQMIMSAVSAGEDAKAPEPTGVDLSFRLFCEVGSK